MYKTDLYCTILPSNTANNNKYFGKSWLFAISVIHATGILLSINNHKHKKYPILWFKHTHNKQIKQLAMIHNMYHINNIWELVSFHIQCVMCTCVVCDQFGQTACTQSYNFCIARIIFIIKYLDCIVVGYKWELGSFISY